MQKSLRAANENLEKKLNNWQKEVKGKNWNYNIVILWHKTKRNRKIYWDNNRYKINEELQTNIKVENT